MTEDILAVRAHKSGCAAGVQTIEGTGASDARLDYRPVQIFRLVSFSAVSIFDSSRSAFRVSDPPEVPRVVSLRNPLARAK